MFDFGKKWTPAEFTAPSLAGATDITVMTVQGLSMALVSGETGKGLERLGIAGPPLGVTGIADEAPYALGVARDRCLAVSDQPITLEEGWHSEGFAVTAMTDGLTALEFSGAGLPRLLAQAATLDWTAPTRSAAIVFAGGGAFGSFVAGGHRLRLFVETPLLPVLQRWLAAVATN